MVCCQFYWMMFENSVFPAKVGDGKGEGGEAADTSITDQSPRRTPDPNSASEAIVKTFFGGPGSGAQYCNDHILRQAQELKVMANN